MRIGIVGGGVVGLACGVALADAGHRVTLFDASPRRDPNGAQPASWGNAGHIAVEQVAPLASIASLLSAPSRRFSAGGALALPADQWRTWLPFGLRLMRASAPRRFAAGKAALAMLLAEAMPAWLRLADGLGAPDLVRQDGHLMLWESAADAEAGFRKARAEDMGTASLHPLSAGEVAHLASALSPRVAGGGRFAGSGQIASLDRLRAALMAQFAGLGGTIVEQVAQLVSSNGRAVISGHDCDTVLITAGVNGASLVAPFGHCAPLVSERGYHVRAAAGDWPVDLPPVVFEQRSLIVTRFEDSVQASSFVEIAAPDAPPDPAKWDRLEAHLRELGLPMGAPYRRWFGARPTLPDYLPAIGRSGRTTNLFYAFGHQHLGLTLSAITAELVRDLVEGDRPAVDLAPFDLERFGGRKRR